MTEQVEQQKIASANTSKKKKIFLSLLAIVFLATVTTGGYLGLDLVTNKINSATTKTEEALEAIKQLQTKYDQLQNNYQSLQKEVQKSNAIKIKYWQPIIIEHLVNLADLTLNTTKDTKLTLAFLTAARQYTSDPGLSAVNHALNKDIADLQVVPVIDPSLLILKIEAINQKVNALSLVAPGVSNPNAEQKTRLDETPAAKIKTFWHRFLTSTINALKDIVVIRYQNVTPLLSPEQETILRLVIQTKLLEAELAIMHKQNKIYHSCLEQIINSITKNFTANQATAADILSSLQELERIDLEPKLPLLTESIAAIKNFISASNPAPEKPQLSRITSLTDEAISL